MKFLVDEMPYHNDDCPFYAPGDICKCDRLYDSVCKYFEMGCDPYYCDWLKEINYE